MSDGRWKSTLADKAVTLALENDDVLEAVINFKIEDSKLTRHRLTSAFAAHGVKSLADRVRLIAFISATAKFDETVSMALAERMR